MDVLALFGWRTCRETPFKNSFSSASLPTRRSRAAMRASYSASTSAAAVSLSSPPPSNLATQILISLRPIPWRLARACSDSPPRNSWTTWRLNSIERVRCLAMGFLLESPVQLADSHLPHLSTPRGALQSRVKFGSRLTFLTFYRYRPRICWPTPNGAPSVGAPARKESSRLVSPLSGCGSPTDHHSGSGTRANNICPATRLGSSANTGCLERRNTISPACQRRPT